MGNTDYFCQHKKFPSPPIFPAAPGWAPCSSIELLLAAADQERR